MTIQLPLVVVLAIVAWMIFKFMRLRWWAVLALVLFGFYLSHTFLAPAIDGTTRTGTQIVNTTGH